MMATRSASPSRRLPTITSLAWATSPGPLDRAGEAFVMWNTDNFGWQESTDPIYKSIPFFIQMRSGRALGVVFDNPFRTFFDFGRERTDRMTFSAPGGPLDYYLLYGPEPKQVLNEYAW